MHQMKAISWNQAKSGDDAAEKFVSNNDKKVLVEATQSLENVLEQLSKSSIPDVQSAQNQTPDAREGASSQRRARSAGEAPGAQQRTGRRTTMN